MTPREAVALHRLDDLGSLALETRGRRTVPNAVDSPLEQRAAYGDTNQEANLAFDAGYNEILFPRTCGPGNVLVLFGGR